jgi:biopolymer transport protein ExbD
VRSLLVVLGVVAASIGVVTATAQPASELQFVLSVDHQGSYFVNASGRPLQLNDSQVVEQTSAALSRAAGIELIVEADASAPHNRVARAAQLLQQGGATRVAFRTKSP